VGGGIGGLAAAHELLRLARERARPLEVIVLEAQERAGGVVATERHEGALLELGPDTLVTHKPAGIALCRRLGLGDHLRPPAPGRVDVLIDGHLHPSPAEFAASLRRSLPAANGDESVASFVRRQLGHELFERFAEPFFGAIYMTDVERLSLAAALPRAEEAPPAVERPAVVALDGGFGVLADALVARLPPGALRLGTAVEGLTRERAGFRLRLAGGRALAADGVLVAVPGHASVPLVRELYPELADGLAELGYASCATVHLAWPRRAVARPPTQLGFFVPRSAGLLAVAASYVHVKFPPRVPPGLILARLFLGGGARPEIADRSDDELVAAAVATLVPLLGARAKPAWTRLIRHPQTMPQLAVGHPARAARLRGRLAALPGLELAGGPLGAYGVPDVVAGGESAAARLLDWLGARRHAG
jgi:protoporphyrinogen/coproporphyrinogen III oxidase